MKLLPALLLQDQPSGTALALMGTTMTLVMLVLAVVVIAGVWKVFTKAGHPGWAAVIPIYNLYILLQIAGRPAWWILLMLIPFVNIVAAAILAMDVAKAFGQSAAWGIVMLFLLSAIGYLVLGFGNYRYQGPAGGSLRASAAVAGR